MTLRPPSRAFTAGAKGQEAAERARGVAGRLLSEQRSPVEEQDDELPYPGLVPAGGSGRAGAPGEGRDVVLRPGIAGRGRAEGGRAW